jgi:Ca2+-binding RTX toxin-like protein
MTGPVSAHHSATQRAALLLQQRLANASLDRLDAEEQMRAKERDADARLEQIEAAQYAYAAANPAKRNKAVYTLRLEDGTRFEIFSGGGASGTGPRGALVMGLDKLARDAGFPEPKTQEETMLQRIAMLELHYAPDSARKRAQKDIENMKKAIELLGKVIQMFRDGLKSGAIPHTPVAGTDGNDMMKVLASGMRIQAGAGNDTVYSGRLNIVEAGDGDDTVIAGSENAVDGGAGNDLIVAESDSRVSGGAGNDTIKISNKGTVDGGAGDDVVWMRHAATVSTGDGNDFVYASQGTVDTGNGDDVVRGFSNETVTAGAGNDWVKVNSDSTVFGGEGDDVIEADSHNRISGGAGNDLIRADSDNVIDGGDGHDVIEGSGIVSGGAGNDLIKGSGTLDGGDGNDAIIGGGWGSSISGGRGDDNILASNLATITFDKGDGNDTVGATNHQGADLASGVRRLQEQTAANPAKAAQLAFKIGAGLSQQDLQVSIRGNDLTLDFGGGDSITITDYQSVSARLVFADGSRVRVADFVDRHPGAASASPPPATPGSLVNLQA